MSDFLLEIGCEELPATKLNKLVAAIAAKLKSLLAKNQVQFASCQHYATPRRLAIMIHGLADKTDSQVIKKRGPHINIALADGKPTAAALGFARSCGVEFTQLTRLKKADGEWLLYEKHEHGQNTIDLLPQIITNALSNLEGFKFMRWGSGEHSFMRPVLWLVSMYQNQIVPFNFCGHTSSNVTHGHKVHAPRPLAVTDTTQYQEILLQQGQVILDQAQRQKIIEQEAKKIVAKLSGTLVMPAGLLDEVVNLVEYPHILLCKFDKKYLALPAEILTATLAKHQKCFCIVDSNNKILPYFITVAGLKPIDDALVIAGNQQVVSARLADAWFFYTQDKQVSFLSNQMKLKQLNFATGLGSVYDKTMRLVKIISYLIDNTTHNNNTLSISHPLAQQAANLAKCDLVTNVVTEMTDMQGIAASYYAANENYDPAVVAALKEQYLPSSVGGSLPATNLGSLLATADKIDSLVGFFILGKQPTGDKDPFALRRAALGIIRISIEKQLSFNLHALIEYAVDSYQLEKIDADIATQLENFIYNRLTIYCKDMLQIDDSLVKAVCSVYLIDNPNASIIDCVHRIQALQEFIRLPAASSLLASYKRINNIVSQIDTHLNQYTVDTHLLEAVAEQKLYTGLTAVTEKMTNKLLVSNYTEQLLSIASLHIPLTNFFTDLMVMDENLAIRNNRIAILLEIKRLCTQIADLALLKV